jgi:hypothetical protein
VSIVLRYGSPKLKLTFGADKARSLHIYHLDYCRLYCFGERLVVEPDESLCKYWGFLHRCSKCFGHLRGFHQVAIDMVVQLEVHKVDKEMSAPRTY